MYERFLNDESKRVMNAAEREAHRLNNEYIGTEHILLGLLHFDEGIAVRVLKKIDPAIPSRLREQIEMLVKEGEKAKLIQPLPYLPKAQFVIASAIDEARRRKLKSIGPDILLTSLLRTYDREFIGENTIARSLLIENGVTLDGIRAEIHELIGQTNPL